MDEATTFQGHECTHTLGCSEMYCFSKDKGCICACLCILGNSDYKDAKNPAMYGNIHWWLGGYWCSLRRGYDLPGNMFTLCRFFFCGDPAERECRTSRHSGMVWPLNGSSWTSSWRIHLSFPCGWTAAKCSSLNSRSTSGCTTPSEMPSTSSITSP